MYKGNNMVKIGSYLILIHLKGKYKKLYFRCVILRILDHLDGWVEKTKRKNTNLFCCFRHYLLQVQQKGNIKLFTVEQ